MNKQITLKAKKALWKLQRISKHERRRRIDELLRHEALPFKRPLGESYLEAIKAIHKHKHIDWYLEIGSFSGASLAESPNKSLAIDPNFQIDRDIVGRKECLHIFQTTSDEFFDSGFIEKTGERLSFCFLDGMHLFEFLLRDFFNSEKYCDRNGIITMHDCCPFSYKMAMRKIDPTADGDWTGDVWKLLPVLKQYRPDLNVTVLDARPTGLVIISNLDPGNTVLAASYERILDEFVNIELQDFGLDNFYDLFDFESTSDFIAALPNKIWL